MAKPIYLYNTLTRRKEEFAPLHAPAVGMYVCGPTVYGDPHLGHVRPAVTFDLLFRLLRYEGYKVRYVRNITDVGHLENDADAGEDKIAKKARLEQLEPMEVAQYYTNRYHEFMDRLGVLRPSIEPHASGHIIEQIAMTQAILDAGYAYVSNGSVYFDVRKYVADGNNYGILSGRNLDDMQSGGRSEDYEGEKRFPADFALWKRAAPEHIMRWPSPWSEGFPGWHMECSAMGAKYLGETFDIHGGGDGSDVPAPRVRDRAVDGGAGTCVGQILGAQQHGDDRGTEDGEILREFHHAGAVLHGGSCAVVAAVFADGDPVFYPSGALPVDAGFQRRGVAGGAKGAGTADEGVESVGFGTHRSCGGFYYTISFRFTGRMRGGVVRRPEQSGGDRPTVRLGAACECFE